VICQDAKGFDRAAFHRDFNGSVVAFFQQQFAARK
jgi:predicted dienelactone hydrolase